VGSDYWAAENFRVQHKAPLIIPPRTWKQSAKPLRDFSSDDSHRGGYRPINYLIQIGYIDLLSTLANKTVLSSSGRAELLNAPPAKRPSMGHKSTGVG
jgi:hypothetical protein